MERKLEINFEEFAQWENLVPEDLSLILAAKNARKRAYVKYSNFGVGAAILLDNGQIIEGNNQENAAYPSGLCAERTAIFYASATYPNARILKIAVVAGKDETNDQPVSPCGACRQAMLEYEVKQANNIEFLFTGLKGKVIKTESIKSLLPFCFDGSLL